MWGNLKEGAEGGHGIVFSWRMERGIFVFQIGGSARFFWAGEHEAPFFFRVCVRRAGRGSGAPGVAEEALIFFAINFFARGEGDGGEELGVGCVYV